MNRWYIVLCLSLLVAIVIVACNDNSVQIATEVARGISATSTRAAEQTVLADVESASNTARVPIQTATPEVSTTRSTRPQPTQAELVRLTGKIEEIGYWFESHVQETQLCVLAGDIDWTDYGYKVDDLVNNLLLITNDAVDDGQLNHYDVRQIERVISQGENLIQEISRKCDMSNSRSGDRGEPTGDTGLTCTEQFERVNYPDKFSLSELEKAWGNNLTAENCASIWRRLGW